MKCHIRAWCEFHICHVEAISTEAWSEHSSHLNFVSSRYFTSFPLEIFRDKTWLLWFTMFGSWILCSVKTWSKYETLYYVCLHCKLHHAYCAIHITLYTSNYAHCCLHIAPCPLHHAHCTMPIAPCPLHHAHCTMNIVNCKMQIVLYHAHCIMLIAVCTLRFAALFTLHYTCCTMHILLCMLHIALGKS